MHHKRKLERFSFKDLFKSDRVWITNTCINSRVMFGQVSKLVSIIMALFSSIEDIQTRHTWSNLCIQLLAEEIPRNSQVLSKVGILSSSSKTYPVECLQINQTTMLSFLRIGNYHAHSAQATTSRQRSSE